MASNPDSDPQDERDVRRDELVANILATVRAIVGLPPEPDEEVLTNVDSDEDSEDDSDDDSETSYYDNDDDDDDGDDEEEDDDEQEDEVNGTPEKGCQRSGGGDCPICFRSLNSDGPHRICCIPCGHVYGRSCLERWLKQRRKDYAKCPQCNRNFKQHGIINLYAQLTTVTNDGHVPSELGGKEGDTRREEGGKTEGEEGPQCQHGRQGWRPTKDIYDAICCRIDTLFARNGELDARLHVLEQNIKTTLDGFRGQFEKMLDSTGERIGNRIDDNFKKLLVLYENSSDISRNPLDTAGSNTEAAAPLSDRKFERILDAMEEHITRKIDEGFKKVFEIHENASGVLRSAPSAS